MPKITVECELSSELDIYAWFKAPQASLLNHLESIIYCLTETATPRTRREDWESGHGQKEEEIRTKMRGFQLERVESWILAGPD
jgi:hypothetical protein